MALIQCPECGKSVSDLAPACPNCGVPIAHSEAPPPTPVVIQKEGMGGCAWIIVIALGIIVAIVVMSLF
jgi:predicted amidophosphoribosyltransferase